MLEKEIRVKNRRKTKKDVGQQLFQMRKKAKKTTLEISCCCGIPKIVIDRWEIGKGYLDLHYLSVLASFFDKKVVISFEDLQPEDM